METPLEVPCSYVHQSESPVASAVGLQRHVKTEIFTSVYSAPEVHRTAEAELFSRLAPDWAKF